MTEQDKDSKSVAYRLPLRIIARLRRMAFWEKRRLPEIVTKALDQYISRHEKRNGEYKPIPEGEGVRLGRPPENKPGK